MPLKARRVAEGLGRGEKKGNKGGRKARKEEGSRTESSRSPQKALKSRNRK